MTPDGGLLVALLSRLAELGRVRRRDVVAAVGPAAVASWLLPSACARRPVASGAGGSRGPVDAGATGATGATGGRVLGPAAWSTLEAATTRILPSDDGPGAREAGVIAFIDAQLATPLLRPIAPAMVLAGELIERAAAARSSRFVALAPAAQDEILQALARGQLPAARFPQREAFAALHTLTLEGFLSDPVHGGNRDMVGWRAVDFTAPGLRAAHGHAH